MAKKAVTFTKKEVEEMLRPTLERIKREMQNETYNALYRFYHSYYPIKYKRSYGMWGINLYNIKEKIDTEGAVLTFIYSVEDIENASYHHNVNAVFGADFIAGYHGGPRRIGDGQYSWDNVPKMTPSPWEIITNFAKTQYGITNDNIKVR